MHLVSESLKHANASNKLLTDPFDHTRSLVRSQDRGHYGKATEPMWVPDIQDDSKSRLFLRLHSWGNPLSETMAR